MKRCKKVYARFNFKRLNFQLSRISILCAIAALILTACSFRNDAPLTDESKFIPNAPLVSKSPVQTSPLNTAPALSPPKEPLREPSFRREIFAHASQEYQFFADIPSHWELEYAPEIASINLYDPSRPGESLREKSLIFIRTFSADRFLTLPTVNILSREETELRGHAAVRYEIEKKKGAANFPHQPSWRNARHKLIDIRYRKANPSAFFVFAYSPELTSQEFERFIASLVFFNDKESIAPPMTQFQNRISKKPFGVFIDQKTSPISPERFRGYHTGTDFEVYDDEAVQPVSVYAICGGQIEKAEIVKGYGGVIAQKCLFEDAPVSVLYGHVALPKENIIGAYRAPGDGIALLGDGSSADTDGERKHLHLGIIKGAKLNLRGYVETETELEGWMDWKKFVQ